MFMKYLYLLAVGLAMAAFISLPHAAFASDEFNISARAAVVMDVATGRVIISKNPDLRLPPASTTKVMTAILAIEKIQPAASVKVSRHASSMSPSKINLRAGDEISVDALLYSVLLKSANDAAAALAEGVGGTEDNFARLMTEKARAIGAVNTHFVNASGLPADNHYSTAYDLALILRYAMQNPRFVEISSTKFATLNMGEKEKMLLRNHNRLLWMYDGAVAGKTGYTVAAKHCYVGEAGCNNTRLIVAMLGSNNPWSDVRALLDKGFEVAPTGKTLELEDNAPVVVQASSHGRHRKAIKASRGKHRKAKSAGKKGRARSKKKGTRGERQIACVSSKG